ncbi:phosphotransferase family protein [Sorangium sp. So ce1078]|uniref:phosphotransferase family protein n=1 Tax=Sorangium sp. So ce1078 TaxID=3133329 RepID=UPI003F5DF439
MALTPPTNTRAPREAHRLDEAALGRWLTEHVEGCAGGTVTVAQFKGGQSNPTYWVGVGGGSGGDLQLVLRKKPPGKLLPSAHAVEREYRVMRALRDTDVPVPDALALCEDSSVLGTPFFVMRYVAGRIFWDPTLPELGTAGERRALYEEYIRVLAALHRVDHAAVGLADYGKVGGFVARQVDRWSKQYEASRTGEVPAMEALMRWLAANVPANDETALVHGDYRIDNLVFSTGSPAEALATLDWELSTLGHPVSDLAYACMGYHINLPGRGGLAGVDVASLGIPTEDEMVAAYCKLSGRGGIEAWPYFMAFGVFRLAAIAQGVYRRSLQGNASSDDAGGYGAAVTVLSELACGIAGIAPR